MDKQSIVVYQVPCSCGQSYIGKTIRQLESRLKEHKDACNRGLLEKSAIAEHAWRYSHLIEWSDTQVVDWASTNKELLVKEALHIRVMDKECCFNRDVDWNSMIVGLQPLEGVNNGAIADMIEVGHLAP